MSQVPASVFVVMGVAGSGKSTVGAALATALGIAFIDGDDLHPLANKRKMAQGIPLDDTDRAPWLASIGDVLARGSVVVACSALKRRYRDQLRAAQPALTLIELTGSRDLLASRLAGRQHEYMPASLLDSQLSALEPPDPDEEAVVMDIAAPSDEIVADILEIIHHG